MILCDDCNHVFDDTELEKIIEPHGEEGCVCPDCGSDDYGEAVTCEGCGEYFHEYDLEGGFEYNGFCAECAVAIQKTFSTLFYEKFTEKEREYINWCFDGKVIA